MKLARNVLVAVLKMLTDQVYEIKFVLAIQWNLRKLSLVS